MNFNLNSTKGAAVSGKHIDAGITNAKFMGITYEVFTAGDGTSYNTMNLNLDVNGFGEYTQRFFEPVNNNRETNQFGSVNPGQLDNFLIAVREIIAALDSSIVDGIDDGSVQIAGNTFKQMVTNIINITKSYIGTEVEVKFLPGKNGFNTLNTYCARITKNGTLGIKSYFIGHDLILSSAELKKIEAAKNAAPTDMKSVTPANSMINDMMKDMGLTETDDLPL